MNPERWERIGDIFAAALALPAAKRPSYLDRVCAGDAELRTEVEELLARDATATEAGFLGPAPMNVKAHLQGDTPSFPITPNPLDGSRTEPFPVVPGYEITREIARGGMGVVYAARDGAFDREVAVKFLQSREGFGPQAVRKFVNETRITGRLQHPTIPPAHQTGVLSDGRPYLVMKLIAGDTLAKLLKDRADITTHHGRLVAVFEQLCQGVAYAHAHGIIHRDLKPANVMVGNFGEVQVMDWGLAKVLPPTGETITESDDTAVDRELEIKICSMRDPGDATQPGQAQGTPAFMPPEQASGKVQEVDRQSDVFGLGAVLCAILTGDPPYIGTSTRSAFVMAGHAELGPAFERLDQCRAEPELVALCKRCLNPEKADRPRDASEVAQAVGAFRAEADERAQRAELDRVRVEGERAKVAIQVAEERKRRRVQLFLGSLVFIVVLVGGAIAAWQWNRAEDERDRTQAALDEVTASRDRNLRNLRRVTYSLVGDRMERKPVVTEADRAFISGLIPMWEELASARGATEEARYLRAEGHFHVALMQHRLGDRKDAETQYRQALILLEHLTNEFPAVAKYPSRQADTRTNLGLLLSELGNSTEAETQYLSALALQQRLTAEFPANQQYRVELAITHNNLGILFRGLRKGTEANEHYRAALDLRERLVREFPGEPEYHRMQADTFTNMGALFEVLGKGPQAAAEYRKALAIREKLVTDFPHVPKYRQGSGHVRNNLGLLYSNYGRWANAEEELRLALTIREKLATEFPAVPDYRREFAATHTNLGSLFLRRMNVGGIDESTREALFRQAEERFRAALPIQERLAVESPAVPRYREELARTHDNLGLLHGDRREWDSAEEEHRTALTIREKLVAEFPATPDYRYDLSATHNHLGGLLLNQDQLERAEEQYRKALFIRERLVADFPDVPSYQIDLGGSCCNFGITLRDRGKPDESLEWFAKAIATLQQVVDQQPRNAIARRFLGNSHLNRARAFDRVSRYAEAAADWSMAAEFAPESDRHFYRADLAYSQVRAGMVSEAVAEVDALSQLEVWQADNWYNLACVCGVACQKTPETDQREEYATKAMDLLRKAVDAGWKHAHHTAHDPDLASLRGRADFQQLLAELGYTLPKQLPLAPPPRPK